MEKALSEESKVSMDQIIDAVHQSRNHLINRLLQDPGLMNYLKDHFETAVLSPIRVEFLKRDLIELKKSPLDLVHYSPLIKQMKEGVSVDPPPPGHPLINQEVELIYNKYRF